MQIAPRFITKILGGQLIMTESIKTYLKNMPNIVEIIIRPPVKTRSNEQNRYYWGVVLNLISKETEHHPEELHEFFKSKYLIDHISIKTSKGLIEDKTIKSTTKLNTKDFELYLEDCRKWALDFLNINIPLPNEVVCGQFQR